MLIFDIAPTELLVLGAVAVIVIPPKDLPRVLRMAGNWVGRARGMARQFRSGFDDMIRESEFKEMEAKWKEENERIMRDFPPTEDQKALMAPLPQDDPAELPDGGSAEMVAPSPSKPKSKPKPRAKSAAASTPARKPAAKKPAAKRVKS